MLAASSPVEAGPVEAGGGAPVDTAGVPVDTAGAAAQSAPADTAVAPAAADDDTAAAAAAAPSGAVDVSASHAPDEEAVRAIEAALPTDKELKRKDLSDVFFAESNVPPVTLAELGLPFAVDSSYEFLNAKAGQFDCSKHDACCMARPHRISISKSGAEQIWEIDPELNPNEVGLVVCMQHEQGHRNYMEDRHRVLYGQPDPTELRACFGVYDGHGGQRASVLTSQIMPGALQEALHRVGPNVARALPLAYRIIEREVLTSCFEEDSHSSGTTALTHAIVGQLLYTANLGDCRAILCRNGKPVVLTRDHKPSDPLEKRRIQAAGGDVEQKSVARPKYLCCGAMTDVPLGPSRVMPGGLAVGRTIGDIRCKLPELGRVPQTNIVSCSPEVSVVRLTEHDDYVISASDGFWDTVSNDEAIKLLSKFLHQFDHKEAVKQLVRKAIEKGSQDNVTVSVCFFTHHNGPWSLDPAIAETVSVPEDIHTAAAAAADGGGESGSGGGGGGGGGGESSE